MDPAKALDFVIVLAVLLFAVSFHESAHAWTALRFGDPTARDLGRISLNPLHHIDLFGSILLPALLYFTSGLLFGYAKPTPVDLRNTRNPRLANLAVSGAGPASNFLLAALGVAVLWALRRSGAGLDLRLLGPLGQVAMTVVQVNLGLAVFNLLPIPPLDGSGVLAGLLGGGVARFFAQLTPFGFLLLILLSSTGVLTRILGPIFALFSAVILRVLS
ncbi:MAG TPA: site-2 protease family protein [Thermoanaerobaculia bacterium]|jgi:Zn-dependent protease